MQKENYTMKRNFGLLAAVLAVLFAAACGTEAAPDTAATPAPDAAAASSTLQAPTDATDSPPAASDSDAPTSDDCVELWNEAHALEADALQVWHTFTTRNQYDVQYIENERVQIGGTAEQWREYLALKDSQNLLARQFAMSLCHGLNKEPRLSDFYEESISFDDEYNEVHVVVAHMADAYGITATRKQVNQMDDWAEAHWLVYAHTYAANLGHFCTDWARKGMARKLESWTPPTDEEMRRRYRACYKQ